MILAVDVGNSQIYGGLFPLTGEEAAFHFRRSSHEGMTTDELGFFLRGVIRENGFDPTQVRDIACCSVVPDLNHTLVSSCHRYFGIDPLMLEPGVKTGLKIRYKDPNAVGADRIASAVGAMKRYPGRNLIIADFGTASTLDVVTAGKEYLGGAIFPGLRISMQVLETRTAKLPTVAIAVPKAACGQTTEESIQAGLYYAAVGAVKELTARITAERFAGEKPLIIATGGFAGMLNHTGVWDNIHPVLVLEGLITILEMNR
ncbi:MAG: type III pantothenate kinase [Spirochaetales bacterium]|jgi:type III pantothenate kinase|nr:type III pantothenate kinase [Spirochaetales bacterium]